MLHDGKEGPVAEPDNHLTISYNLKPAEKRVTIDSTNVRSPHRLREDTNKPVIKLADPLPVSPLRPSDIRTFVQVSPVVESRQG
jgi:hypothetical protein